jgi:hypothetical protein
VPLEGFEGLDAMPAVVNDRAWVAVSRAEADAAVARTRMTGVPAGARLISVQKSSVPAPYSIAHFETPADLSGGPDGGPTEVALVNRRARDLLFIDGGRWWVLDW